MDHKDESKLKVSPLIRSYADDYTSYGKTPSLHGKISNSKRDSTTKWPPRNQDLFNVNVASSSRGFMQNRSISPILNNSYLNRYKEGKSMSISVQGLKGPLVDNSN